jgi:hypothetical protein
VAPWGHYWSSLVHQARRSVDSMRASQVAFQISGPTSMPRVQHVGLATATKLGAKSVGGGGAIFCAEGSSSSSCRSVLAQTGLGVELEQRQRVHSASCVASMA